MSLDTSSEPAALITGDPLAAQTAAEDLRVRGYVLDSLAQSLASIDPGTAWRSAAGDALRPTVMRLAQSLADASGAHLRASTALAGYADEVRTARAMAARAVETWQHGQQVTTRALAEHRGTVRRIEHRAALAGTTPVVPPFVDPGEPYRAEAQVLLAAAQRTGSEAGDQAALVVQAAGNEAPDGPGFWDQAGDVWSDVWHGAWDLGADIGNGVMSFGNALVQHPDLMAELIGGLLLMQGGALMEAGGVALDLTVVGAPAGIALNVTGAGVITAGAGLAGQAAVRAGIEAVGDDAIRPFEGSGGSGGSGGSEATPGATGGGRPAGVKPGWVRRRVNNDQGWIYQRPGAVGDADSVRIMDPTPQYPNGYVRFTNRYNQPVDLEGKPTGNATTHIPIRPDGTYPLPQGW
jgi:hypothetical protein